jgi:putative membrane protein insertion efficiency factor
MPVLGSPYTMKGPPRPTPVLKTDQEQTASAARNALLGVIDLYRRFISPTQGARCSFYPSCSTFGMQAVQQYGPLKGGMMTADRLTRCNHFKQPGPDYYLRPDGRLYDPVEANLLLKR